MDRDDNQKNKNINDNKISQNNIYYSNDTTGKLLFMRHGETFFNLDPDKQGRLTNSKYVDCHLDEKGIEQSKSLQNILNKLSIEKIYISPMYRAFQTISYALESHPNLKNITVVVNPLVNEVTSCVQDYLLNIKQTKQEFNMNSKVKFDWSLFDEYVKGIKWDENFYYFDNFNCFENNKKDEMYQKLKELYDMGDFASFKEGLAELAKIRYAQKKRFESLKHLQFRFNKFMEFIKENHKNSLNNTNDKILVVTHDSLIKCATDRTPYETDDIQKYNQNSYSAKNCEIISIKF
jgi:broad specificity phosphatase PhoE